MDSQILFSRRKAISFSTHKVRSEKTGLCTYKRSPELTMFFYHQHTNHEKPIPKDFA